MAHSLDPGLLRDLTEAKAALARHGIVIIRTIETELEPALLAEAKNSMASSPRKLAQLDDEELDKFTDSLRKSAMKSTKELKDLYVRLLARLGIEYIGDLVKELEGIAELFKWERISKTAEPINQKLADKGFAPIELSGPEAISESFVVELQQKWPPAFERFKALADEAARRIEQQETGEGQKVVKERTKRTSRKR